jgi:hypothetical protein
VFKGKETVKHKFPNKIFIGALGVLMILLGTGCLGGGGSLTNLPDKESTLLNLHIRLGRVDASAPVNSGVLNKRAAGVSEEIILKSMKLRFISNLKDTVWGSASMDGEGADAGPGGGLQGDERSVFVNVELPPLRWWNLEIKTYDQYDSVIHYGVVNGISSKGGQTVNLTVPVLNSRYSLYEARYSLPASIYAAGLPEAERVYQKIFFNRLVLSVDGQVVRDSSSFSPSISGGSRFITAGSALKGAVGRYFFRPTALVPDTITHLQTYQYVLTGNRVFQISAYGYLEGDSVGSVPRLLFQGSATLDISAGAAVQPTPVVLDWKGPGSSSAPTDTAGTPGNSNWSGVGLKFTIGSVGKIIQEINVPGGLDL